jgi:hypothetical protein
MAALRRNRVIGGPHETGGKVAGFGSQGSRAVEQDDIPARALSSPHSRARSIAAFSAGSPPVRSSLRQGAGHNQRHPDYTCLLPIVQMTDAVWSAGGQFIQPAVPVDHKGCLPAQRAQHFGQRLGQGRVINTD